MRKILGKIWAVVWKTILGFFVLSIVSVIIFRWLPIPITPLMIIRDVEQLKNDKGIVMEHDWVPLEDISPKLQLAVVCSEDQNYLKHFVLGISVCMEMFSPHWTHTWVLWC